MLNALNYNIHQFDVGGEEKMDFVKTTGILVVTTNGKQGGKL
jgi:hypothetical protein